MFQKLDFKKFLEKRILQNMFSDSWNIFLEKYFWNIFKNYFFKIYFQKTLSKTIFRNLFFKIYSEIYFFENTFRKVLKIHKDIIVIFKIMSPGSNWWGAGSNPIWSWLQFGPFCKTRNLKPKSNPKSIIWVFQKPLVTNEEGGKFVFFCEKRSGIRYNLCPFKSSKFKLCSSCFLPREVGEGRCPSLAKVWPRS